MAPLDGKSRKIKSRGRCTGKRAGRGNKGTGQRNRGRTRIGLQFGHESSFVRKHPKVGFRSKQPRPKLVKWPDLIEFLLANKLDRPEVIDKAYLLAVGLISQKDMSPKRKVKVLGPYVTFSGGVKFGKDVAFSTCLSPLTDAA